MNPSVQYYEDNYTDYAEGWSKDHLHYGFWFEDTHTHEESLINHSREVMGYLDIQDGMRVLDAGCGSGGTSRFVASTYNTETVGITLSTTLLDACKILSINCPNKDKLSFHNKDFTHTGFPDESFDRIFAIESVCYSEKSEFIKETYRLLKSSGRLVVSDYFLLNKNHSDDDLKIYREWSDGWAIKDLCTINEFAHLLHDFQFTNIEYLDKTPYIQKCSKFMYDGAKERLPLLFILDQNNELPPTRLKHVISTLRQWECIQQEIWKFCIFVADKR